MDGLLRLLQRPLQLPHPTINDCQIIVRQVVSRIGLGPQLVGLDGLGWFVGYIVVIVSGYVEFFALAGAVTPVKGLLRVLRCELVLAQVATAPWLHRLMRSWDPCRWHV